MQIDIASTYTTIAQAINIGGIGGEAGFIETPTLDQSGAAVPMSATGYTTYEDVTAELYWDPVLAVHQQLTDLLTAPTDDEGFKFIAADAASTEYDWTGGVKTVSLAVDVGDYMKANVSIANSGITWPT